MSVPAPKHEAVPHPVQHPAELVQQRAPVSTRVARSLVEFGRLKGVFQFVRRNGVVLAGRNPGVDLPTEPPAVKAVEQPAEAGPARRTHPAAPEQAGHAGVASAYCIERRPLASPGRGSRRRTCRHAHVAVGRSKLRGRTSERPRRLNATAPECPGWASRHAESVPCRRGLLQRAIIVWEAQGSKRSEELVVRGTIRDRLSSNARARLIGREDELGALRQALADDAPVVVYLHGLPGIGKSALAAAFAEEVRSGGGVVLVVECGAVEPTEFGLCRELGRTLGCEEDLEAIAAAFAARPPPALLLFDGYEVFRLLDAWMRQVLVPALPDRVLVLFASKFPPSAAWTEAPAWQTLFQVLPLGPLSNGAAVELLTRLGVAGQAIGPITRFAAGHPLALTLAAQAARVPALERGAATPVEAAVPLLARRYLAGIADPTTREALRIACVARRIHRGLLRALSPEADADALYVRLAALPFIMAARDGLAVHEGVREALAADLLAADPELHRRSRQLAWRHLSQEARSAPLGELWRCTADLIHLIRNPVVREAFFPCDAAHFAVEPARPDDLQPILDITASHDGHAVASCMERWWHTIPGSFFVVRASDEPVAGFYCLLDSAAVISAETILRHDPVAARFVQHLREHPTPARQTALFVRRWLGRVNGERPSSVQAACWLDVKRHYLEQRPRLRRVYLAVHEPEPHAAAARTLGFRPLLEPVPIGNRAMHAAVLDMGPGSVDGWLLQLAAEELGIEPATGLLDRTKRALHVDGALVPLTRREFDVMTYLAAREGDPVARDSLIQDVWGLRFDPGSNVVDAVIASLRRKLGGSSGAIETVRGFGYLYRASAGGRAASA